MAGSSFDAYYTLHYVAILRFAERRIDKERAEDIAAETFAIAWKKFSADSYPGLPWLYQTTRNLLGSAYRKRSSERRLVSMLEAEERTARPDEDKGVLDELQRLTPKYREVLQLTYWEGLSAAEVAEVVGCSEPAAWKRISRAKQKLKVALTERARHEREEARSA